jgi:hypothetical protein
MKTAMKTFGLDMSLAPSTLVINQRNSTPKTVSVSKRERHSRNRTPVSPNPVDYRKFRDNVEELPQPSQKLPRKVRSLQLVEKGATALTAGLILLTFGVYGWTVYIPKLWSKEFTNLETLQRHERHLTATNESIKDQLARQAETEQGLKNLQPTDSLFLTPSPVTPVKSPNQTTQSQNPVVTTPLAY